MHGVEFAVLLHRALEARVQELNDATACEGGFSDHEVVHRVRVACRRLRAVLGLLDEKAYPRLKARAKDLREFTRGLGGLRNLDVQITALEKLHGEARRPIPQAAVEHVLETLARRRQKRLKALGTKVPSFAKLLNVPSLPNPFEGPPVALGAWSHLQPCIHEALFDIPARRDQEDIKALHESRIQVKRLRDTLEALAPAFPTEPTGFLMDLRAMQMALGDHHDQAALEALLRKHRDHLAEAGRPALSAGLDEILQTVGEARQQAFERFCALEGPWDETEFSARIQALLGVNAA
ncbi:MAG: CHAD domain-containing protein [Acidobacteriota bacterium]|nr:CHAD domain-containing protein [Acidobacteriota bacterium]